MKKKPDVIFNSWSDPYQTISDQYPFILLRLRLGLQACLPAERLFQGETDGSSFPNGGLRVTHSAAAFTTWDRTSAPFVLNKTLYIPCAFVTHFGNLDLPSSVVLFWWGNLQWLGNLLGLLAPFLGCWDRTLSRTHQENASMKRPPCCVPWMPWRCKAYVFWRPLAWERMPTPCTATLDGNRSEKV